jgi:glycosyltransferase involved in cell wall biosynthesis
MKIALILRQSKIIGGLERVVISLANELARKKNVVIEIILLNNGGILATLFSPSIKIVEMRLCGENGEGAHFYNPKLFLPSSNLVKYLKKSSFDVVMPAGTGMSFLLGWLQFLYRFSHLLLLSTHNAFEAQMEGRSCIVKYIRLICARFLFRQGDVCICVSKGLAEELKQLKIISYSKIEIIYNPIISSEILSQLELPTTHLWFYEKSKHPLLISVGRLTLQKRVDVQIQALRYLRNEYGIEARLMILGDGEEKKKLEYLAKILNIEDSVLFLGFVPAPLVYVARADVFILSSQYEGFGNVLVEALACGVNVVSTDCTHGPREIIQDGKWGRLVPVNDVSALARAIYETLSSPLSADFLKIRAKDFTAERAAKTYYDIMLQKIKGDRT